MVSGTRTKKKNKYFEKYFYPFLFTAQVANKSEITDFVYDKHFKEKYLLKSFYFLTVDLICI